MGKIEESLSSRNLHSDAGMELLLQTHQCDGQMCNKTDRTHFKALGEKKIYLLKNVSSPFKIKAIKDINSFPGGTADKNLAANA